MRGKTFLLIVLVVFTWGVFAQTKLSDSLKRTARGVIPDTARFDTYLNYIKAVRFDYPDSAIRYSEIALSLAEKIKDNLRIAQGQNLLGTGYYFRSDYTIAEEWQRKAIKQCRQYNLMGELPNALSSLALALQSQSKFTEAIEAYFESIQYEEANHNPRGLARSLGNLAILYRNLSDYGNAIKYAKQAIRITESKVPDWYTGLAGSSNTVGLSFLDEGEYDSAIFYLQKSYRLNRKANSITFMANAASNITYCYQKQNKIDSAARYIEIAFNLLPKISNQSIAGIILINVGSVRFAQNKTKEALQYTNQGLAILEKTQSKKGMLDGYTTLAALHRQLGNHKLAFDYLNEAYQLRDSLNIEQAQSKAANVERDYELQKKQLSIDLLAKEAKLNEAKLKNEAAVKRYLIISIALLVIAVGGTYYGFRQKIKSNKRLQAKNDEIAGKNELLESVNRNLQDNALRGQMKPHFIFNSLNSIQYLIVQKENDKAFEYLSKFSQLLRSALEFSDQKLIDLDKELKWLDLYVKLESLRFSHQFDFDIRFDTPEIDFKGLQLPPFMLQPFLENAIAHGLMPKPGDRKLNLNLKRDNGGLQIKIKDNGIGREQSAKQKSGRSHRSFGLDIVKKRFEILSSVTGKPHAFQISDGADENGNKQGTCVTLTLPAITVSEINPKEQ